jgi:hypothetical protein
MADSAGLPALIEAIRHLHGLEAKWLNTIHVKEAHEGKVIWDGEVQTFEVDHPKTSRVYAWSHESGSGKQRFHSVLGVPPVDSPQKAVQTRLASVSRHEVRLREQVSWR